MQKIILSLFLMVSLITYTQAKPNEATGPVMSMTDITGKSYKVTGTDQGLDIEGMKGKVVILEFFGHKCPPCLASIPHLNKIQEKYKDSLAIIAIEVQGYNTAQVTEFAKQKDVKYTMVSEEKASELVNYIQIRAEWRGSIPFTVALDPSGDVKFVQAGMLSERHLEEIITELSGTQKTQTPKS